MDDLVSVVELMLGLLAALALLVLIARQLNLPYPILLVVGGWRWASCPACRACN